MVPIRSISFLALFVFLAFLPTTSNALAIVPQVVVLPALATAKAAVTAVTAMHATHPVAFTVSLTCAKTAAADLMVQRMFGSASLNWKRLGVFAAYGALYLGILQHFLFTQVYAKLFPLAQVFAKKSLALKLQDPAGAVSVLSQVMLDLCIHWPFFAIPAYYLLQEFAAPSFSLTRITDLLKENWCSDVLGSWAIWWPACLYNYGNVPLAYQVPFTAGVSFIYTAYISLRRGGVAARVEREVCEM